MAHFLDPILNAKSVAIVGASPDPSKRGYQAVRALLDSGFAGAIYPVHPAGGELLGLPVAPDVAALESVPDLAFVCTRAELVADIVVACSKKGIGGVAVPAVGFRESGGRGAALERKLLEVISTNGIRLIGPNTSGILNSALGLNLVGVKNVRAGRLGLLSQSGNVALDIIARAERNGIGLSTYVGVGNETDVSFHEYLEYFEQDAATAVIMIYAEGFRYGRKFIDTASRVSLSKPVVLLKGGRSDRGVAAARSHTGAIAGSYPVLRAALRQAGVSEVLRSDELLAVGITLAEQPVIPAGAGILVLSDGGGHGTLAADSLAEFGAPLATLSENTRRKLRSLLGRSAGVANPIDIAGSADSDPSVFFKVLDIVSRDRTVGGVLLVGLFGGYSVRFSEQHAAEELETARLMHELMERCGKTLVVHSLYADAMTPPLAHLIRNGVPVVSSLEVGARCMRAAQARGLLLQDRPVPPVAPAPRKAEPQCLVTARRENRSTLMETEVRELLAEHNVPLVQAIFCKTEKEVVEAVASNSGPVVLKVVSPAISHKTDAGGVLLNVSGSRRAASGFRKVMKATTDYLRRLGVAPEIRGVLVAQMLPEPVAQIIVGVRRDPQYGPVLTVGAGGVEVEVHGDTTLRGLPVGRAEVLVMLEEIRIVRLLDGFRGKPPADRGALADTILNIAACAMAHREIHELEANPVFAYSDRAVVVDARAFLPDWTAKNR